MNFFYLFFHWICVLSSIPADWFFLKRKTYYEDKKVQGKRIRGGALVISNHNNTLDFVMNTLIVFPRNLHVIASEHAFKNPLIRFGMKFWGGIEANRLTKSMKFMDAAAEVIRGGDLVQIFPEGQNTDDGQIHPFKKSYIVIAHRAGCPIIPIINDGQYGLFKRTRVMIGKPIELSDFQISEKPTREELAQIDAVIYQKVLDLRAALEEKRNQDKRK